ncbi:MAG: phosphomannomutase/phosphoglucomutase [Alphaproteobacteria bacterium]|nr:phosphomannomutase/phosphoglucomutase [Alphaproteobacteria bacterium]
MSTHRFEPTILREYDVRGIVGESLFEADALALGRAFGTRLIRAGGRTVAVGFDGRPTSPALETKLVEGLLGCGLQIVRVGLGPTPMLSYAAKTLPTDGGVMVTGSHNPARHNGFKMTLQGKSFFGADIQALGTLAAEADFERGAGSKRDYDLQDAYAQRLADEFDGPTCALTIGWDPGNGAAGEILTRLIKRLPGRHHVINGAIDGTFPNHHPDPTVLENLAQLQTLVRDKRCDLGIAFDGDADRIGVVDGKGRALYADQLMLIYAEELLARMPGKPIIADVKSSQVLFDGVAKLGGRPVMWKTGHSLIKAKMAELKAPFAGEMSGHLFFADRYYGFDDALYAAVRLMRLLTVGHTSLAALRDRIPAVVNTPELRFACPEERKFAIVAEVLARQKAKGAEVSDIDGARVRSKAGWWLLRASNTQAVLVARCEAADEAGLAELKSTLVAELDASGVAPPPGL